MLKDGIALIMDRARSLPAIISSRSLEVQNKTTSDANIIGERMRRLKLKAIIYKATKAATSEPK